MEAIVFVGIQASGKTTFYRQRFFEAQVQRAIGWNAQRAVGAAVPAKGLLGTLKRLERPDPDKGFDRLCRVHIEAAGEFIVEAW